MGDILATSNVFLAVWDDGVDKPALIVPSSNLVVDSGLGWIVQQWAKLHGVAPAVVYDLVPFALIGSGIRAPQASDLYAQTPHPVFPFKEITDNPIWDNNILTFTSPQWSPTELKRDDPNDAASQGFASPISEVMLIMAPAAGPANPPTDSTRLINRAPFNFPITAALNQSLSIIYQFTFRAI